MMSETDKHRVTIQIEQIIERSRHQEEMFLIDSKTAASDILDYLQKEHLILAEKNEDRNLQ
jgi:predicted GTPase